MPFFRIYHLPVDQLTLTVTGDQAWPQRLLKVLNAKN